MYCFHSNKYIMKFIRCISDNVVLILTLFTNITVVYGGPLPKNETQFKKQYLGTIILINGSSSSAQFKLILDDPDANPTFELRDHFSDLFLLLFYLVLYTFIAVTGLCVPLSVSFTFFSDAYKITNDNICPELL